MNRSSWLMRSMVDIRFKIISREDFVIIDDVSETSKHELDFLMRGTQNSHKLKF